MRQLLIAGNWKMHGTRRSATRLAGEISQALDASAAREIMICPPFVHLVEVGQVIQGSSVILGAQSLSAEEEGAYTGEVSGAMLRDCGCRYVIVGHSERRALCGENDALVARKFMAAQRANLIPILCLGETLEERRRGQSREVVTRQLQAVLDAAGIAAFARAAIAYEPVWAIGTGNTATPEQAQEVHALIRSSLAARDAKIAAAIRLLYGGSVKASNASALFHMPDIDGGLVGGAALQAQEFAAICRAGA